MAQYNIGTNRTKTTYLNTNYECSAESHHFGCQGSINKIAMKNNILFDDIFYQFHGTSVKDQGNIKNNSFSKIKRVFTYLSNP